MRRRASDFRRPVRRRLSDWIWWLLGIFTVAGLVLFVVQHQHQHQDRFDRPIQDMTSKSTEDSPENFNFTEELLSTTSFARQLSDQMTLAKAYVIIAKEHSNLQLAWELSSQIRNCQRLLSQAAVQGKPITLEEVHPIVSRLSHLIYKAQDSHYDISTIIVTLKNHAQALEERAHAATAQGAEFAQLAAESMPKSLHCLNIKLTEAWFKNPSLKKLSEERRNSPRLVDNNLYTISAYSQIMCLQLVSSADHLQQSVFHVVTDRVSYRPMMTWFLINDYTGCTVIVQSIEEFSWLNASKVVKQLLDKETQAYYFGSDQSEEAKFRNPKFVSLLNHLRLLSPRNPSFS